jgi:hypothetical protein
MTKEEYALKNDQVEGKGCIGCTITLIILVVVGIIIWLMWSKLFLSL